MQVTFWNVRVDIEAADAAAAYAKLCETFETAGEVLEYETDSYMIEGQESRSVEELWPVEPAGCDDCERAYGPHGRCRCDQEEPGDPRLGVGMGGAD